VQFLDKQPKSDHGKLLRVLDKPFRACLTRVLALREAKRSEESEQQRAIHGSLLRALTRREATRNKASKANNVTLNSSFQELFSGFTENSAQRPHFRDLDGNFTLKSKIIPENYHHFNIL
jgi:hypothetical protein